MMPYPCNGPSERALRMSIVERALKEFSLGIGHATSRLNVLGILSHEPKMARLQPDWAWLGLIVPQAILSTTLRNLSLTVLAVESNSGFPTTDNILAASIAATTVRPPSS